MNALLIPIYEPTDRVLPFLKQFKQEEFDVFVVVDDGSGEKYQEIFAAVEKETVFSVISYPENHGKGHALKTGMRYLVEHYPDLDHIITADGDGQHRHDDIIRVASRAKEAGSAVVLGARDFRKAPPKSASGNKWSARYFHLASGVKITDCQTGLRAIPKEAFDLALYTYGERFDYEMNFLLPASREFGLDEVIIETIYEDENKGTHFRPVKDSLLIMRTPILYILIGILCFTLDLVAFHLLRTLVFTDAQTNALSLLYCHLIPFLPIFFLDYILLSKVVFHHKGAFHQAFYKFFVLSLTSMLTVFLFVWGMSFATGLLTLMKALIGIVFGCFKYMLNLMVTFANRKFGNRKRLH